MLEARDSKLLAALRKTALLTSHHLPCRVLCCAVLCWPLLQEDHRSLKATSEAMLEAKDSELLAALRKTALLTEELGQLRQQQQQQHVRQQSLSSAQHQQQHAQGRISSSSAMDGGGEVYGVAAGGDDGSSVPSRHDGSGPMTAAAYCSQQLLTGYTASEPGDCSTCCCTHADALANAARRPPSFLYSLKVWVRHFSPRCSWVRIDTI